MSETVLSISKVSLSLQSKLILSGISAELPAGKVLAVVGHNGAGKTTLFHAILGLKFASDGKLLIQGIPSENPASRAAIGYVPERPYLNMDYTLRETLTFLGKLQGMEKAALEGKIDSGTRSLNLYLNLDQKLRTFSKGMLQKTLLLQAEMHDPALLILDEPMSGLDPEARQELKERLKARKVSGKSILFSSHAPEDVKDIADTVLELEKGVVKFYGPASEWRKS